MKSMLEIALEKLAETNVDKAEAIMAKISQYSPSLVNPDKIKQQIASGQTPDPVNLTKKPNAPFGPNYNPSASQNSANTYRAAAIETASPQAASRFTNFARQDEAARQFNRRARASEDSLRTYYSSK